MKADQPLADKHCVPCIDGHGLPDEAQARTLLEQTPGWAIIDRGIERTYKFKNFFRTMSFVNAVAFIANQEDHHPDLQVSYDTCRVRFTTHAAGGLTENDFICAGRVSALLEAAVR